jgi:hypothetical protein
MKKPGKFNPENSKLLAHVRQWSGSRKIDSKWSRPCSVAEDTPDKSTFNPNTHTGFLKNYDNPNEPEPNIFSIAFHMLQKMGL